MFHSANYCYVIDLWCAIYSYGFVCLCLLNCVYSSMLGFTCIYNPNVGFLGFPNLGKCSMFRRSGIFTIPDVGYLGFPI